MNKQIRNEDAIFVNLLQKQLQEYIQEPLPEELIESTVRMFMLEIRKSSRKFKNMIQIDTQLYWDIEQKQLWYRDKELNLTKKERDFLALLFSNTNKQFSYEIIFVELWNDISFSNQEKLKTLVKQLRKKLPKNFIKNIFSFGYKIDI